ncbi:MAG: M42 family peptidase [Planctomycetota bacterium]|nr:MAG: M42 family peptidase [Planctomycetota bacterium]
MRTGWASPSLVIERNRSRKWELPQCTETRSGGPRWPRERPARPVLSGRRCIHSLRSQSGAAVRIVLDRGVASGLQRGGKAVQRPSPGTPPLPGFPGRTPLDTKSHDFLISLLETPSPSGYEWPVQDLVRDYLAPIADSVASDSHGNVIGTSNPGAPLRMLLAGHCDQIGLIIQYIDGEGYLSVQPIGGWDPMQLIGSRVVVWGTGGPVPGVIARKPIHLLSDEERKVVPKIKDLWIDIGAPDRADAESVVRIGDCVTVELRVQPLRRNLVASPAMDDKVGLWVVLEAFRRAIAAGPLSCALHVASTVQEEIGLRGAQTSAYGVNPHVAIAVDVTHATDCPTIDKKSEGDISLGKGPVVFRGPNMNPHVVERLLAAASANSIPCQLSASGRATPTDANVLQTTRAGVATALVSVPNRYMHSGVETVSLDDLDHAADLLAAFIRGLEPNIDWAPRRVR